MNKHNYFNKIFRGKVKQNFGFETAMEKSAIVGEVFLSPEGLSGDACADQRHHGGLERALHQYPCEHYEYWNKEYEESASWHDPGMGENLSSTGMTEDTVCIGDRYRWGQAVIEVSQPRSPCYKLNKRWGIEDFSTRMQETGRCGWLYRVIQSGVVSVDYPIELIERVPNALTVREVCNVYFGDPLNQAGLIKLKQQDRLSNSWKTTVANRLETGEVENWNFRLLGHA